jgi:hypothetical protein
VNRIYGDRDLTITLGLRPAIGCKIHVGSDPFCAYFDEVQLQPDANVMSTGRVTSETSPCDEEDNQNQKACS